MALSNIPGTWKLSGTILLLALILSLSSCTQYNVTGGTGGGTPLPHTLQLEFLQVNIFHFTWIDIADEIEYRLLEDIDGQSGYSVIANIPANSTSYDLYLPLPDHINSVYLLQALRGGSYQSMGEVAVTGSLAEAVGYFKASNTEEIDGFGFSVAISGDGLTMAVGAPFESSGATGAWHPSDPDYDIAQADNSALDSGAVYVFSYTGSYWDQEAYLKAWNAESGDEFGGVVAISYDGDTLAVGAAGEDSNGIGGESDNSLTDSGAAYIYTRTGDIWAPEFYAKASNPGMDDLFGWALALSDDGFTLAVSAPGEDSDGDPDDNSVSDSGAVYVYDRDALGWYRQDYLKAFVIDDYDSFGNALALSEDGNTLAVGYFSEDSADTNPYDNSEPDSGAVAVFSRVGAIWDTPDFLKASNAEEEDLFGTSVSLSGDGFFLAVGAVGEDGNGLNQSDNSIADSGAVYVFEYSGGTWTQIDYIKAPNADSLDEFGGAVSLSGDGYSLAIGAGLEDSSDIGIEGDIFDDSAEDSGAVYLYVRFTDVFSPYSYIKASNTGEYDFFGYSVDLSWDGLTMAVGAPDEDGSATGIGGDPYDNTAPLSGAVYMY
ncbi:MAG: integrin [Acidobacteria bacterium]|nr:integrin [Acidobacteriota bacterium]